MHLVQELNVGTVNAYCVRVDCVQVCASTEALRGHDYNRKPVCEACVKFLACVRLIDPAQFLSRHLVGSRGANNLS